MGAYLSADCASCLADVETPNTLLLGGASDSLSFGVPDALVSSTPGPGGTPGFGGLSSDRADVGVEGPALAFDRFCSVSVPPGEGTARAGV